VNPLSGRAKPPIVAAGTPPGASCQGEIELFRFMRMRGIFGVGAKDENATGDRIAGECAALADPFAPAVVPQETRAEIGECIGLPPVEFAGQRRDALNQRPRLRRREPREISKRGNDGQRARDLRPRSQIPRPVAKERLGLRPRRAEKVLDGVHETSQAFLRAASARRCRAQAALHSEPLANGVALEIDERHEDRANDDRVNPILVYEKDLREEGADRDDEQHERAEAGDGGNEDGDAADNLQQSGELSEALPARQGREIVDHHLLAAQLGEAREQEQRRHEDAQNPKDDVHVA
jgi:hypothetical protein